MKTTSIPRREAPVPGYPALLLTIYGVDKADKPLRQGMEQGYFVSRNGVAVARADLSVEERAAVQAYLVEHHPEHAKL